MSYVSVINFPSAINLYALSLECSLIPHLSLALLKQSGKVVMVGRFVLQGIWEEIFLIIFKTTLPNGIFLKVFGLRFIRSESQDFLFSFLFLSPFLPFFPPFFIVLLVLLILLFLFSLPPPSSYLKAQLCNLINSHTQ